MCYVGILMLQEDGSLRSLYAYSVVFVLVFEGWMGYEIGKQKINQKIYSLSIFKRLVISN